VQNKAFSTNKTLNIRGRIIDLNQPKVMGILNVTPDSFYDGARYTSDQEIINQVAKMLKEGATFVDVGGYSTRPGAVEVNETEELSRVTHAIRLIAKEFPEAILAIDTFRSIVAKAAVEEGASMINDISGGDLDPKMPALVATLKVPYIVMHMRGNPQTMTTQTTYTNLLKEVTDYFHQKIDVLAQMGIKDIVIDPGFGFAKTSEQNFELLHHLDYLTILGKPLLTGLSRKSMIWKTLNTTPEGALNGTTSLNTIALLKGASILRVHDVAAAVEVIALFHEYKKNHSGLI
jgi:dihydropteroate synthase